jgi:transcriptional regulator with XRE-family HTH domain
MCTTDTKKPELVDKLVAHRVRAYRKERGLSQVDLAKQLGVTFQQIQKYEHGINRIGAGRLYKLAEIFNVPIQALYPESEDAIARAEYRSGDGKQIADFALSADGWRLCRAFLGIADAQRRKTIIALIQELTEDL